MYQPGGATLAFAGPGDPHAVALLREVERHEALVHVEVVRDRAHADERHRADARRVGRVDRERLAVVHAVRARP